MNIKHYAPESHCRNGHMAPRFIATDACTECAREARRRFMANPKNREKWTSRDREARRARAARDGWSNDGTKRRQQRYDRKRRGIPTPTRPEPENCECCGRKLEPGKRTHIDHQHGTDLFRGWLCNRCNMSIGGLGDSIEGLEKALAYLRRALLV